jgi:Na+-driven multidrug efflux pump
MMLYNFGASIMRAVGETKKPLYYLAVSGVLNVIINAVTVIFFNLHVIGVALGTTVSQCVSAAWILYDLSKAQGGEKLNFKKIRFHKEEGKRILIIGAPMGISSCMFSLSNLSVQSAINAYGDMAIAGNTVASNIEAIGDAFGSSVANACVTFVGQNLGAQKPERVHRIIGATLAAGATALACFSVLLLVFGQYFCMLFNTDPVVIEWAMKRLHLVGVCWTLVSVMNAYGAALRGMGYSIFPMLINLVFTCIFRVLYVWFVYSQFTVKSIEQLYILYPTTWVLSGLAQMITYYILGKKHGHFKKKEKVE